METRPGRLMNVLYSLHWQFRAQHYGRALGRMLGARPVLRLHRRQSSEGKGVSDCARRAGVGGTAHRRNALEELGRVRLPRAARDGGGSGTGRTAASASARRRTYALQLRRDPRKVGKGAPRQQMERAMPCCIHSENTAVRMPRVLQRRRPFDSAKDSPVALWLITYRTIPKGRSSSAPC